MRVIPYSVFYTRLCQVAPSSFAHCFTSSICSVAKAACETEVIYTDIHLEALYLNDMLRIAPGQIRTCSAAFNRDNGSQFDNSFPLLSAAENKEAGEA